jgi:hypothetical protein
MYRCHKLLGALYFVLLVKYYQSDEIEEYKIRKALIYMGEKKR